MLYRGSSKNNTAAPLLGLDPCVMVSFVVFDNAMATVFRYADSVSISIYLCGRLLVHEGGVVSPDLRRHICIVCGVSILHAHHRFVWNSLTDNLSRRSMENHLDL